MNKIIVALFCLFLIFQIKAKEKINFQHVGDTSQVHFSLRQCLEYAYSHQKAMLNSSLDVEIAKSKIRETTGIGLPQITASGQYLYFPKLPITLFPDFISPLVYGVLNTKGVKDQNGNIITVPTGPVQYTPVAFSLKNTSNVSLDLSQILFDGSYLVGLQASKVYKELSTKALIQTKIQTATIVSKAYYNVLVGKEQLDILDADIARLNKNFEETKSMNKNGFVEKIDLSRLEYQLNNLITQKKKAERLYELSYYALKFQMGMPLETKLSLNEEVKDINMPETLDSGNVDPKQRIEYSLQETQVHLYQLDVKRNKFAYLPSLVAIGEYKVAYQNNSFSELFKNSYPQAYIGANLSVPIFSGLQKSNRLQQAKLTLKKSENDLAELSKNLSLDLKNAQVNYLNNLDELKNQEKNRKLAAEIYRVTKIKYEQGIGSSLEVTTAETELKTAENNYLSALFNALIAKVDLERALGTLAQ